jgi:addiction module HigA family antidote
MSIANTKKRTVSPIHPGEMLREDFMVDYGLTVTGLAAALGVSRQTANELLQCRRAVSPVMALRLSRLFGNSSTFWLNAQNTFDLWHAERRYQKDLDNVRLLKAA